VAQLRHCLFHLNRRLDYNISQLHSPWGGAFYLIYEHGIGCGMYKVGDVIQAMSQQGYVLSIKGGNEGAMQLSYNLMGNSIALMLKLSYFSSSLLNIFTGIDHLLQFLGCLYRGLSTLLKKVKKAFFSGNKRKSKHYCSSFADKKCANVTTV
jgi:hypothetical protein